MTDKKSYKDFALNAVIPILLVVFYSVSASQILKLCQVWFHMDTISGTFVCDIVLGLVFFGFYFKFVKPKDTVDFKFLKKPAFYVVFPFVFLVGQISASYIMYHVDDPSMNVYQDSMQDGHTAMAVVLSCIIAPVTEELLCRGIIYGMWRKCSHIAAFILQAVLFAAFHGTLAHLALCFLFALYLAYVYEVTENIWLCALIHSISNIGSFLWNFVITSESETTKFILVVLYATACALVFTLYINFAINGNVDSMIENNVSEDEEFNEETIK